MRRDAASYPPGYARPDLFRLDPAVAVEVERRGPLADARDRLTPGRLLLAAALAPGLLWAYQQSAGVGLLEMPALLALLAAASVLGALTLATYLPQRGHAGGASPCAVLAGLLVPASILGLQDAASTGAGLIVLAMVGFAFVQRVLGASAC